MKKFFAKVAVCLAIGTMGVVTTSCGDDEIISAIIQELITNLIGQRGETYQYQVKGSVQKLYKADATQQGYMNGAAAQSFTGSLPVTINNTTATVQFPAMNVDGMSMSAVTVADLALTAGTAYTSMDLGDATGAEGSVTVNGTVYPISSIFIDTANLTSEKLTIKTFQLFFGENLEYVVSFTNVTGEAVSNQ